MIKKAVNYLINEKDSVTKTLDVAVVITAVVVGTYLKLDLMKHIIPLGFLVWFVLNPIPSKKYAQAALFFLVLTPFFLSLKYEVYAELTSIYAFFSLIMTVIYSTIELKTAKE